MATETPKVLVPPRQVKHDYPVIPAPPEHVRERGRREANNHRLSIPIRMHLLFKIPFHVLGGLAADEKRPPIYSNSHFLRVIRYARPSDYAVGIATAAAAPAALLAMERISPSRLPSHAVRGIFRLTVGIGLCAGFLRFYNRPSCMPPIHFFFFLFFFLLDSFHRDNFFNFISHTYPFFFFLLPCDLHDSKTRTTQSVSSGCPKTHGRWTWT